MSMVRLIIGAALGFMIAEGVLLGLKHVVGWLWNAGPHDRNQAVSAARAFASLGAFKGAFNKYVVLIGAGVAAVTVCAWTIGDYLAAKPARRAAAAVNVPDAVAAVHSAESEGAADELAGLAPASRAEVAPAASADRVDPYRDPEFKVRRHPHRAGSTTSLTESLVQRSEAKARAELLTETQQHRTRSQYDCEAAEHADKYVKAGLDVWGFAAWELKYFPMDGYQGATLPQCKGIRSILDSSRKDLQSTLAEENQPRRVARRESRDGGAVMSGGEPGSAQP